MTSSVERRFYTAEHPTARFYANDNTRSYDIGIGKNLPFSSNDFDSDHTDNDVDIYEAAQFMVEHESIQRFPSPLDNNRQQHLPETGRQDKEQPEVIQAKTDTPKSLPKVAPKRQLEDVLFIATRDNLHHEKKSNNHEKLASTQSNAHAVMIQHRHSRKLDVNSIWVEMLIYDQQKTATAAFQTI